MRIGVPGQAQLSLVRQSPLIHGRFTFQDEVGGSSPPRPTIRPLSSGNADRPLRLSRLLWISQKSTGTGSFQQPHGLLTSTFADYWAHFPDARPCGTAAVERITSRADVDAAKQAASSQTAGCLGRRCQRDVTELAAVWPAASAATSRRSGHGRRGSSRPSLWAIAAASPRPTAPGWPGRGSWRSWGDQRLLHAAPSDVRYVNAGTSTSRNSWKSLLRSGWSCSPEICTHLVRAAQSSAATAGSSMTRATPRWVPSGRSSPAMCAMTPESGGPIVSSPVRAAPRFPSCRCRPTRAGQASAGRVAGPRGRCRRSRPTRAQRPPSAPDRRPGRSR
jgi:hypothetical protein